MKNQPKSTLNTAQAEEPRKSEAALKIFPVASQKISDDKGPIDGDGEGPSDTDIFQILIEIALNGYMVTFILEDGTEEKSVHVDFDEVLSVIRSRH